MSWHGIKAWQPDWADHSRTLAIMLRASVDGQEDVLYAAFNMYWEPLEFQLPEPSGRRRWHQFVDTAGLPPADAQEPGQELRLPLGRPVLLQGRSSAVLVAR